MDNLDRFILLFTLIIAVMAMGFAFHLRVDLDNLEAAFLLHRAMDVLP